jgi:hypothetical protein
MNMYTLQAFLTAFQEYFVTYTVNCKQSTEKKNEELYAWRLRHFLESEDATSNADAMLDPDEVNLFGDAMLDTEVELYPDAMLDTDEVNLFGDAWLDTEVELYADAVFPLGGYPFFVFDEKELAEPDEQEWQNVILPFKVIVK